MTPNYGEATGIGWILLGLAYVVGFAILCVVLAVVGVMLAAFALLAIVRWTVATISGRPAPDIRGEFAAIFDIARSAR